MTDIQIRPEILGRLKIATKILGLDLNTTINLGLLSVLEMHEGDIDHGMGADQIEIVGSCELCTKNGAQAE